MFKIYNEEESGLSMIFFYCPVRGLMYSAV